MAASDISNSLTRCDARRLGCLPRSASAGFNNATAVNGFFTDWSGDGSFEQSGLDFDGGWWGVQSDLATGFGSGGSIRGMGGNNPGLGYNDLATFSSTTTRIVREGAYAAGSKVLNVAREGLELTGLTVQGYAPAVYTDAYAQYANFADYGLYIPKTEGSDNTGKVYGTSLGLAFCKIGMQLNTDSAGNHADDVAWQKLWIDTCGVGIQSESQQVVNVALGSVHCQGVGTGIYAKSGGNWTVNHVYYGELANNITPIAVLRIGSSSYSADADKFLFGTVTVDGAVATAQVLVADGEASSNIEILMMHIPPGYAPAIAFTITGPKRVIIRGGGLFQEGMFHLAGNASGNPTVLLDGCVMKTGENMLNLCTATSNGTIEVRSMSHHNLPFTQPGDWQTRSFEQHWNGSGVLKTRIPDYTTT